MNAASEFPARVLGPASPGFLRVIIGPGIGMLDGGLEIDLPVNQIPEDLRLPNSEFMVVQHRERGFQVSSPKR